MGKSCGGRRKPFVYDGVSGLTSIALHVGINRNVLVHRMYHIGMTLEEAIAKGKGNHFYEYKGITGVRSIAEAHGVAANGLQYRVKSKGMSFEDAIKEMLERGPYRRSSYKARTKGPIDANPSSGHISDINKVFR